MKVLIADKLADAGLARFQNYPQLEIEVATGLNEDELCGKIRDYDAVIVRSAPRITEAVISSGHRLRAIGRAGIGVDNIDVPTATERGIVVLNTPDANATTTAELTIGHLLSLSRHLPAADRSVRAGKWERSKFVGAELCGKTIGIIGYGTIGRIVAARCQGLKMRVIGFDPFVTREVFDEDGVVSHTLEELLSQSDYISLHCPLTEKTRHLLDAKAIAQTKPGARIINCARGGLIDEAALASALESGHLAGAALDVFEKEPPLDSPLLQLPNVVFTPHLGASTEEAQVAVGVAIVDQIAAFLLSGEARNAVNIPYVPSEELNRGRPFQELARRLGLLLAALVDQPLSTVEVSLCGKAAELDPHPIAVEALAGLLKDKLSVPVNRINARHLARRQGITLTESVSDEETQGFLSLLRVAVKNGDSQKSVVGTLLGERQPRLIRIDDYEVEAIPEGTLLLTQHDDRPGVVGALGQLLARENVNISRRQVGIAPNETTAIAIIGISSPLTQETLREIEDIPAIEKVCQITL